MEITRIRFYHDFRRYNKVISVFMFSVMLYIIAAHQNDVFLKVMSVASFLTWHVIFEFASILVSFSIFTVTYVLYEESRSLRAIILGCSFLVMGILDAFHTLSYKGMADFFIANTCANRATTLWILARFFGSLGFMFAVAIPTEMKCKINKTIFAIVTIVLSSILFFIVTYYPHFFPAMFIDGSGLTTIKLIMEYVIIFIMIVTFCMVVVEYERTNARREYMFMIALIFLIFSEFAFTNYGSVYDAYNYLGHIYKIIGYLVFYQAIFLENVRTPYREMKKARYELKEYSANLNETVQKRTKELQEMNEILLKDIEYAKEMQRCLLPTQMPQGLSVSFNALYLPAERLSGDFYNVIKLDEENIAIYIGDVSGHGVSAAMLTVFANQNIKPLREVEDCEDCIEIINPGYVIKNAFKSFNRTNFNVETYIVMLFGIYNTRDKSFTYASAGMNVSPYIIKKSGEVIELNSKGFPICKLGDYFTPFYDDRKVVLERGDKIIFYSDGLVDAKNLKGKIYGQQQLKDFLEKNYMHTGSELESMLKNNLYMHLGVSGKIMDDVTFLIMEIN